MALRDDRPNRVVIALAITGMVLLAGGGVVGSIMSGAAGGIGGIAGDADEASQQNPQELDSQRDLSAVERQLAQRAAERIRSGEINLSRDEVESSVGEDEFDALVEQYSAIAEETDTENRATAFLRIRSQQRAYASATAEYQRLYRVYNGTADYSDPETQALIEELEFVTLETVDGNETKSIDGSETAQRSGQTLELNESQQREAARQLEERWHRVNETGGSLIDAYRTLETIDDEDYTEGIAAVQQSRQNISEQHETVREEWFRQLTLTAETSDPRGSFTDPIIVSGRVMTVDESPYRNETLKVRINDQPIVVETNATGHYTAAYRPASVTANATEVSLQVVPTAEAMVIGLSRPTIPVEIQQTPATVSVSAPPDAIGFNETLAVDGRVASNGAGAANVSYRLLADGQLLAEGRTNETGRASESIPLPATIPTGDQPIRLTVGAPDRALTPGNGTTTVLIRERPTALSLDASQTDDRALLVAGELRVPDGPGVPRRTVELFVNGTSVGTTTTGVNGTFETTVVVPEAAVSGGYVDSVSRLSVAAEYEDTTTNLERSRAETTTLFSTGAGWGWLAGLGLVVLIAGGAGIALLSWRRDQPEVESVGDVEESAGWQASLNERTTSVDSLLEQARERLASDQPVVAAQLAYAAVRTHLEAEYGGVSVQTHWEFYRACQQAGADDTLAVLRDATELYERVMFASESVSVETITPILERIEQVVEPSASDG